MSIVSKVLGALPAPTGNRLSKRLRRIVRPAWLGTLRRNKPLSDCWGYDRGSPIGRYYIDLFLDSHRSDIHGRVLEVAESLYTLQYGTDVQRADIVDIDSTNAAATIVTDLAAADVIPAETYDCLIITQTLHLLPDVHAGIAHLHRILRRGGVLLVTVPSIAMLGDGSNVAGDYWRFTSESCALLFGERFGTDNIAVRPYGNFLAAIAGLAGMAEEELSRDELNFEDKSFPVLIAVRAVKL